jgi:hypothetical protein
MRLGANHLLHLVARITLRTVSPERAKRIVDAMALFMPPLSVNDASLVARTLEGSGTCLTRALTVAARLPGSQVVIGTDGGPAGPAFAAHAWVEQHGNVVGPTAPSRYEIARL